MAYNLLQTVPIPLINTRVYFKSEGLFLFRAIDKNFTQNMIRLYCAMSYKHKISNRFCAHSHTYLRLVINFALILFTITLIFRWYR